MKKQYSKPNIETVLLNIIDIMFASTGDKGSQEDKFDSDPFEGLTPPQNP